MSELIERLDRWAQALPNDEPLPVTENEKYELISHLNEMYSHPSADRMTFLFDRLYRGGIVYFGHRVMVI